MRVKEIELLNFRNYESQKIQFHEKANIITGNNAQGKTNLLESLYLMSLGKSFRTNRESDFIRFGKEFARAKGTFDRQGRTLEIEFLFQPGQRQTKIDGIKITKHIELLEQVYMVVFSPEDLKIVKEEPEKRRKFLDREICQVKPIYWRNLSRYKKILLQRNHLLKKESIQEEELAVWDEELVRYGVKVIEERKRFLEILHRISSGIHHKITEGKESLILTYEPHVSSEEEFRDLLTNRRKVDLIRRTTTVGPHKDDFRIEANGIDLRNFGSQGQQRTAALALKLAEILLIQEETGETPILLLDDVLSELDQERQRHLIEALQDVQLFLTTTELSDYLKENIPDHKLFVVEQGTIL